MKKMKFLKVVLIVLAISFAGCKNMDTVNNSATEESETSTQQNNSQDEATTEEATEEITTEETETEEITTEEVTTEEVTTEEVTTEEATTEEATTEEATTEETTEETTTEETIKEDDEILFEYTCQENDIPAGMKDNVKNYTEYEIGAYLYGDIDADKEKELLAAYLDESVGQWKILRFENETAEPYEFYSIQLSSYRDRCSLGLMELNGKIYYTVDLQSSWVVTEATTHILEENESGVNEVLSLYGYTLCQGEDGDIILQSTYYGARLYKPTGIMEGRVWGYSYLTYDEESGQFKEYVANEITEEEFLTYEGSAECLEQIKTSYADYEVKYSFLKRNNGLMYIECEYEDENYIYYDSYLFNYADNVITYVGEKGQGMIGRKFTSLDEV